MSTLLDLCYSALINNKDTKVVKSHFFLPYDLITEYRRRECITRCGSRVQNELIKYKRNGYPKGVAWICEDKHLLWGCMDDEDEVNYCCLAYSNYYFNRQMIEMRCLWCGKEV